jgi:hypothetical protein
MKNLLMIAVLTILILGCKDKDKISCREIYHINFPVKFYHWLPDQLNKNQEIVIVDSLLLNASDEFQKFNISYQNDSILLQIEICRRNGTFPQSGYEKLIQGELKFNKIGEFKLFNKFKLKNGNDSLAFIKNIKVE